jgi:ribosomal protein S18 acetylase RimI-like enzyme
LFRIVCQFLLLLTANVFAEAIGVEDVAAFETPGMWQAVYEPWQVKVVESHKNFLLKTQVIGDAVYTNFAPNMTLPAVPTWVSSLQALPESLGDHTRTTDLLTTMVMDLEYHSFDTQTPLELDIRLATTSKAKDDFVNVASESLDTSRDSVYNCFQDVFQDTSDQFEFLVGYKSKKPVVAAVVVYEGAYASIYWVCTIPSERRQGFGRTLMITALERVRRRNIRWVVLQAQPMGEGIYRKLGFIPVGYLARY